MVLISECITNIYRANKLEFKLGFTARPQSYFVPKKCKFVQLISKTKVLI